VEDVCWDQMPFGSGEDSSDDECESEDRKL
jgi:hypothetical protein